MIVSPGSLASILAFIVFLSIRFDTSMTALPAVPGAELHNIAAYDRGADGAHSAS